MNLGAAMEPRNILPYIERKDFRRWLEDHHSSEKECWVALKRGSRPVADRLWYLDAVEEALCFGWIDTTNKIVDGVTLQKFSPRAKRSKWSELNKERCRRLEKLGLMTDAGRTVLPDMSESGFSIDPVIMDAFHEDPVAWDHFTSFPSLYQRVRIDTIQRDMKDKVALERKIRKLIELSHEGEMFGEWDDYGRLRTYRLQRAQPKFKISSAHIFFSNFSDNCWEISFDLTFPDSEHGPSFRFQ